MSTPSTQRHGGASRERGAVLVVGLIFIAVLALLGTAAYTVATQEERMSGNSRDRIRAFEAAEASARDCESLLTGATPLPAFNGTGGMYVAPPVTDAPKFEVVDWTDDSAVRVLAASVADVARQPRCIVEEMLVLEARPEGGAVSGPQARTEERFYRVTAVGYGTNPNASMTVQTTYRRR
jgi:type IV pilus assembly protein PilX